MKKRGGVLFFLLCMVLIVSFISAIATYTFGEPTHSIDKEYGPGSFLRGWINISFDDEPSDSWFESPLIGDIAILSVLLAGDPDFDHDCDPVGCSWNYDAENDEEEKIIDLEAGESVLVGFKIPSGEVTVITGFSMDILSDAGESEGPQLSIDILNNGEEEWGVYKASANYGEAQQGCYGSPEKPPIGVINDPYCERIELPPSPRVKIGANLIQEEVEAVEFEMSIESFDGESGECDIIATEDKDYECTAMDGAKIFVITEGKNYSVCIKTKERTDDDNNKYKINYEESEPCGFVGGVRDFSGEYNFDFDIFAKPGKYDAVGSFTLDNEELGNSGSEIDDVEDYILDYLEDNYDKDCTGGCIIPIRINSIVAQRITISNPSLTYRAGIEPTLEKLYNLTETAPKITAEMQKLKIDAGKFRVPDEYDEYTISLEFEGEEIFEEEISVEKVPIINRLLPMETAAGFPTPFKVFVSSEKNLTFYKWEFGDGENITTSIDKVTHTYDSIKNYDLKVTVTDVDGRRASETFNVTVDSAREVIEKVLGEKQVSIEQIKAQLGNMSSFERGLVEDILKINDTEIELNRLETLHAGASTEAEYQIILESLLEIDLPIEIFPSTSKSSSIFYPEESSINPEVLAEIAGEGYDSSKEDSYIDAILAWNIENVDITLIYNETTAAYKTSNEPLLNVFEIDVTKKAGAEGDPYIVLKNMSGLSFDGPALTDEESGYVYIQLIQESMKIVFATTEDVDFINLPLFVSPAISELSLSDFGWSPLDDGGKLKRWVLFALVIVLLIILGTIFWVVLQTWYRKKYEDYLFKNKNNLFNLLTWIENAKKRELKENEIRAKLKKQGWSSEQLRYAMRKHAGKSTGMAKISRKRKKNALQGAVALQKKIPGQQKFVQRKKFK